MQHLTKTITTLLIGATLETTAAAGLINASFEQTGGPTTFSGWDEFGNSIPNILQESAQPYHETFHATLFGQDLEDPDTGQLLPSNTAVFQDLPASAGQRWRASVWATHPSDDRLQADNRAYIHLEFINTQGSSIETHQQLMLNVFSPVDVYQHFVLVDEAPAGTTHARITLRFYNCTCPFRDGEVYLDAAALRRAEDLNGDGVIDVVDLLAMLGAWGACPGCPEDLSGDDVVDTQDLLAMLGAWG